MKYCIWSVGFLALCVSSVGCGKPESVSLGAGEYSYTPPAGWEEKDIPGMKGKAVVGPPLNGFAPNINVMRESYSGSVEAYADANIATIKQKMPTWKPRSPEPFATAADLKGVRVISENTHNGVNLRQTFYFFGKGSKKYAVTCSCLAQDGDQMAPTFETAMKTFRLNN